MPLYPFLSNSNTEWDRAINNAPPKEEASYSERLQTQERGLSKWEDPSLCTGSRWLFVLSDDFLGSVHLNCLTGNRFTHRWNQNRAFYQFTLKSLHRSLEFRLQMTNGKLWVVSCKLSGRNMLVVTCQVKIKGDSCGTPQDLVYSWLIHFIQSQLQPFHEFYLILCTKVMRILMYGRV